MTGEPKRKKRTPLTKPKIEVYNVEGIRSATEKMKAYNNQQMQNLAEKRALAKTAPQRALANQIKAPVKVASESTTTPDSSAKIQATALKKKRRKI